ncbi:MAG: hypothetical protein AAFX87_13070 [Bacteroidota bacterium]
MLEVICNPKLIDALEYSNDANILIKDLDEIRLVANSPDDIRALGIYHLWLTRKDSKFFLTTLPTLSSLRQTLLIFSVLRPRFETKLGCKM